MGLIYEVCHGGIRHWMYQGDGVDLQGRVMGAPDWIGAIESICGGVPWDTLHWLDLGDGIESWGYVILAGSMELFHGDTRHWLERGNGVDLWRCVTLAGTE